MLCGYRGKTMLVVKVRHLAPNPGGRERAYCRHSDALGAPAGVASYSVVGLPAALFGID